jgi:hypothetical protein
MANAACRANPEPRGGCVVAVQGSVVDVRFPIGKLPASAELVITRMSVYDRLTTLAR